MNHYLQVLALGRRGQVQIDSHEFAKLKVASATLGHFFDFSENYRVVVETFKEVERATYLAELDHILYSKHLYTNSAHVRVSLSSPVLAYLSSSRYFIDSTNAILPRFLDEEAIRDFNAMRSAIYDGSQEYRFTEALRNYSQHRAIPFHGVVFHDSVEDPRNHDSSDFVTALALFADRELLDADGFTKKALDGMPAKINIIRCLRAHMEGLWRQHDFIIKSHSAMAETARVDIDSAIKLFKERTGEDEVGLHAFVEDEKEQVVEELPLLVDWDDARKVVVKECGNLNNLHRRYITGKLQKL